ncbi:MAG: peptidylprolyl isomerase [Oscillospiraceae bacterium]
MKKKHMLRALAAALALPCLLLATGCGGPAAPPSSAVSGSESISAPVAGEEKESVMVEIVMKDFGVMKLELDSEAAPITVENFVKLAREGFYDGLTFHRIQKDFMIQGGDPDGNGSGGPGYGIKGEFADNGWDNPISHTKGVISMARSNLPDSAGSQFFLVHGDATFLDGGYAAFGHIVEGLNVLDALAEVECEFNPYDGANGAYSTPVDPPVIETIRVVED